ncbi:FtsH protease activity modulator HflK [Kordiimonas marina]|uniref:FtsH protease activity modulator HflK n=1 Tax=Kordiimonas marina TaxID=2872312 RepID=UPI001FF0FDFF|nr:FtsH protease activity modulator HflK [Kordiimonas marina]MCJ9427477.1 FtsH protease activity modulator HflK [Kordiimonas marina]
MPWQNNGDGDRPNPWGSGPRRGGGGGGEPPQIDDIIRKGQEQIRKALPGGGGGVVIMLLVAFMLWLASGIYRVGTNEQGVVLLFGKWIESSAPGLHWHLPYPIESAEVRGVTDEQQTLIGSRESEDRRGIRSSARPDESLMLTADENIVDVRFNVVWKIKDLGQYLFKIKRPEQTVKAVSESVMRELVGETNIVPIITKGRDRLQTDARALIQQTLDSYQAGVEVIRVQILEAEAPAEVKDAFLDVQRAEADQQRFRNEAEAYRNKVVNEAEGNAEKTIQQAEAYKAQTIARAEGEAARFKDVYAQYALAKDVTKKRLYLETMEDVLSGMHKVILDAKGGTVTYLPVGDLLKTQSGGK